MAAPGDRSHDPKSQDKDVVRIQRRRGRNREASGGSVPMPQRKRFAFLSPEEGERAKAEAARQELAGIGALTFRRGGPAMPTTEDGGPL